MIKIGIIGSGNWSLALSKVLISSEVTIKARNIDKAKKKFPKNKKFFIIDNFEILNDFDVLFLANPSQSLRGILNEIPKNTKSKFVICSKGIEKKTKRQIATKSDNATHGKRVRVRIRHRGAKGRTERTAER